MVSPNPIPELPALDSITTCFKMALMALLVEFICQEYLDRYRLMPRTFIKAWMALPVTIRQTRYALIYEVAPNPRDPLGSLLEIILEDQWIIWLHHQLDVGLIGRVIGFIKFGY